MARKTLLRRAGAAALGLLPLVIAGLCAMLLARDAMELASAAIAIGTALSLASLIQLAALERETRRLADRQDDMRSQALALARCMKAFNARLAAVETGLSPGRSAPEPGAPGDPAPDRDTDRQALELFSRDGRWGIEVDRLTHNSPETDASLCLRLRRALAVMGAQSGQILIRTRLAPSEFPTAAALVRALAAADEEFAERFVLGLAQSAVSAARDAESVAQFARAGVKMALTDVVDVRLDGVALRACNFVCVVGSLPPSAWRPGTPPGLTESLAEALKAAGVEVVDGATPVMDASPETETPVLNAQPRPVSRHQPAIIPWRALPMSSAEPARQLLRRLSKAS